MTPPMHKSRCLSSVYTFVADTACGKLFRRRPRQNGDSTLIKRLPRLRQFLPHWQRMNLFPACLYLTSCCGILVSLYFTIRTLHDFDLKMLSSRQVISDLPHNSDSNNHPKNDIPVFYNLFVNASNEVELQHVTDIVNEQFSYMKPWHHPVFVHSIGQEYVVPHAILLQHHQSATEMVTLRSLWEYCRDDNNVNATVVYLHSKGSFHPSAFNDQLRKLDSLGALSEECSTMPDTCSVCMARFSPFPHPHPPGNMWAAKCSYVQQLLDPASFERTMEIVKRWTIGSIPIHPTCLGAGRFAAEHWILSHPSVQPCDLYTKPEYGWGYKNLEKFRGREDFALDIGPRFPRKHWRIGCPHSDLNHRLNEYTLLYDTVPDDDWWGWEFWWEEV
jgi:hypothetical protein